MTSKDPEETSLQYTIRNSFGDVLAVRDFALLPVGKQLQTSLRRGFESHFGHLQTTTQKQNFSAVRIFCLYLSERDKGVDALRRDELQGFVEWLAKSNRKNNTNQSVLNVVKSLLAYLVRQRLPGIPIGLDENVAGFAREQPTPTDSLPPALKPRVLDACRGEIEQIEARMQKGANEMRLAMEGGSSELGAVLSALLELSPGYVKKADVARRSPSLARRVKALGGFRAVYSYLFLTHQDLLPFYLAIVVETGGNPEAIHEAPRDCFVEHDRTRLVWFVWHKKRGHREQATPGPLDKEWSVAGVARKLLVLNENLVGLARPRDRRSLFLAMSAREVGRSCTQLLHEYLKQFRTRHSLPPFTFKEFRSVVAENMYLAGGIEDAAETLNHRHSKTTQRYVNTSSIRAENERAVVRYAGLLESAARLKVAPPSIDAETHPARPAETVFGFGCKDPLSGIAQGSKKGTTCEQFFGCSTCSGAIVILDDPKVVAKLRATAAHLRKERSRAAAEGWLLRFQALWEVTLRVLELDLLPLITDEMHALASQQIVPALPRLE